MSDSTSRSHAVGDSIVPQKLQEKLPEGVEKAVPNAIHDTGPSNAKSHATGDSAVPEPMQKAVPKGAEEALPDKVHPTN
ncbi:MAG: hypothetical protein L6R39_003940 [Caloplaca ligustica]|nr:MAG: hypothetical protein L6R39_003940 [Caloplaca ligustica]